MSLLKSVSRRANNLLRGCLEENIVFLHIPKCGGSSVGHAIRWHYLTLDFRKDHRLVSLDPAASSNIVKMIEQTDYPDNTTTDDYPLLRFREYLLLYFMRQENTKYISGHFTFSETAYREFQAKYAFITVLRDPVKRWISSYFYNRYKEADHCKIEVDITTHLQSDFGRSQGHEYVKFLGGPDKAGDYTSKQAIDRAKRNLHKFDIVGLLEYQEDFLNQFEDRFGIRLKLERRNQSPKPEAFRKSIITEEIIEKVRVICQPDCEVYQYAIDNLLGVGR